MNNFNEASSAMDKMATSEGAMSQANDIYLDSVQARVQQLKNAFVEFSQSAISANVIKDVAEFAKGLLSLISGVLQFTNVLGGLKTVIPLVITLMTIFKGESIAASFSKMWGSLQAFGTNAKSMFSSLITSVKSFGTTVEATATTTVTASQMITSALGVIGLALAAANMVISTIQTAIDAEKERAQAKIDAGLEATKSISDIDSAYENYNNLVQSGTASTDELSDALDTLCDALGITRGQLESSKSSLHSYEAAIQDAVKAAKELKSQQIADAIKEEINKQQDMAGGNIFSGAIAWIREQISESSLDSVMDIGMREGLVSNENAHEKFFEQVLGISPDDIYQAANDVTFWLDKMDDLQAHIEKIRTTSKWGENDPNYKLAKEFQGFLATDLETLLALTEAYNSNFLETLTSGEEYQRVFSDIRKEFEEMGSDGAKPLADKLDSLRNYLANALMESDNFTGSMETALQSVDAFLTTVDGFDAVYSGLNLVNEAMTQTAKGLDGINQIASRSTDAFKELDDILKNDTDYDTNQKKRVEYYQNLLEEMNAGNFGGLQYAKLAEAFGVSLDQSIEKQKAQIAELGRYYNDLDQGMVNFLNDVNTKVPASVATWDEASGKLQWDPTKLDDFAKSLQISKDMLADLMNTFKMGVTPSDWIDLSPEMLRSWLEYDGILSGTSINMSRLTNIASGYGYKVSELTDKLKTLEGYENLDPIELTVDPSDIDGAVAYIQAALSNVDVSDTETAINRIVTALSGVDEETTVKILGELDLDETMFDAVVEKLNETYGFNIETSEAKGAMEEIRSEYDVTKQEVEKEPITITVTDGGSITVIQHKINEVGNALRALSNAANSTEVPKKALGTKNAKGGPTLLGDEFSASGQPKPELVVSGDRAYLAGVNGPVVRNLNPGDVVYTYKQTKQILGNNLKNVSGMPAFGGGTNYMSSATSTKNWGQTSNNNNNNNNYGSTNSYGNSDASNKAKDDAKNWFEILYERHNHYRKMDKETDKKYFKWLKWAHKEAYKQQLFEVEDYHKYQEELRQLQKDMLAQKVEDKKHEVTMGKRSDESYYKWLNKAAKKWYKKGKINREEYRKYEEEVYQGLQKVQQEKIQKAINDKKHEVTMGKRSDESYYNWLKAFSKKLYKERKITLEEYQKYEEEVYEGLKRVQQEKIQKAIDYKKHLLSMDKITEEKYYNWLKEESAKWYKEQKIDIEEYRKYEEEVYAGLRKVYQENMQNAVNLKKRQIEMYMMSDKEYFEWLSKQTSKELTSGRMTTEDYESYQEEIFKGMISLFDDYLNDVDHLIDMYTEANMPAEDIAKWSQTAMKAIEDEIAAARKRGLTNNDEYVQNLQKKWWSYYKQSVDKQKESLDKQLQNLKDFYAKQKELLSKQNEEDKYLEQQAEKRKKIYDLELQLAQLELDNSAWAQKRRLELKQQLSDAQKELDDFEKDHAIKTAEEMYDELEKLQEKHIEDQKKKAEEEAEQAVGTAGFPDEINAGGTPQKAGGLEAANKIKEAQDTLQKNKDVLDKAKKNLDAATSENNHLLNEVSKANTAANTAAKEYSTALTNKNAAADAVAKAKKSVANAQDKANKALAAYQKKKTTKNYKKLVAAEQTLADAKHALQAQQGILDWRNSLLAEANSKLQYSNNYAANMANEQKAYQKNALSPYMDAFNAAEAAVAKAQKELDDLYAKYTTGYASGTRNATPGMHRINERGSEALFKTSDGKTYKLFSGGEHVFTSGATDFLHDFADNPPVILANLLKELGVGSKPAISGSNISQNITLGDIIINGDASQKTISDIRREQRAQVDYMLRELNRLNK